MKLKMEDMYRKIITTRGRTENRTEKSHKALKRDQEAIMAFMSQRDVPGWYRGLSIFQMEAADSILNALRDDSEQSTSHRVRSCLNRIGLIPMVNCKQTKILMRLSRGNDLAFLWFLNELHYKTKSPEYTVNEQLICSTIAHLDMITTMRELDRILPPPQAPKKRPQDSKRKKIILKRDEEYKKRWLKWKRSGMGPYFEPMRMPPEINIPLTVPKPEFAVKFAPYHLWDNPNYIVPNENSRWYANYDVRPSRRIAQHIINEQIQNIFDDFEAAALKSNTVKNLCENHKTIANLESHLETELKMIVRDRYLKSLNTDQLSNQNRVLRIQKQLENDVERYMTEFRQIAEKTRKQCLVKALSHESRYAYLVHDNYDFDLIPTEKNCHDGNETIRIIDGVRDTRGVTCVNPRKSVTKNLQNSPYARVIRNEGGKDCNFGIPQKATSTTTVQATGDPRPCKSHCNFVRKCRSHITDFGSKYLKSHDYGHSNPITPTESQTYFHAPTAQKPCQFDYRKIFHFKQNNSKACNIKRAFVEAVDSDLQVLHQLQDENMPLDLDAAIHNCARKIWKNLLAKKIAEDEALDEADRELERKLDEESAERLERIRKGIHKNEQRKHTQRRKNVLNYNADYYNPDDLNLMHQMLKDALEHMSKNPKFVLASLPDAHKIMMLREWVCHRFGKRYSRDYLLNSLNLSWKLFHALDTVGLNIPKPSSKDMGRNLFMDYYCHDYVLKKSNMLKNRYYNELNRAVMDQARVLWFIMRPQLCSKGEPRKTYFAYMPARIGNIVNFRPWRPDETMRSKFGGEKL